MVGGLAEKSGLSFPGIFGPVGCGLNYWVWWGSLWEWSIFGVFKVGIFYFFHGPRGNQWWEGWRKNQGYHFQVFLDQWGVVLIIGSGGGPFGNGQFLVFLRWEFFIFSMALGETNGGRVGGKIRAIISRYFWISGVWS